MKVEEAPAVLVVAVIPQPQPLMAKQVPGPPLRRTSRVSYKPVEFWNPKIPQEDKHMLLNMFEDFKTPQTYQEAVQLLQSKQ